MGGSRCSTIATINLTETMTKRKAVLKALKERINKRLDEELKAKKEKKYAPPPRYDDVFFQGLDWLNKL